MSGEDNAQDREYAAASMQYAMQVYQERHGAVTSEINRLVQEIGALQEVEAAIGRSKDLADRAALIPCGMGFYVHGRTGSAGTVAVNIGAGLVAEKSPEEAKQIADGRIERMNGMVKRLLAERKELEAAIYELSYKLQGSTG